MVGPVTWPGKMERTPYAAIRWWWEIMKRTGVGAHDQTWRHRKNNWVRGFEHALTKILRLGWREVAKLSRDC